jgi:hypothetical protein
MKFNPKKSECIKFSKGTEYEPVVTLDGQQLKWKSSVRHLGNYLNCGLNDEQDIQHKRSDLFARMNLLESQLSCAPDKVKMAVFATKCCHMYGCEAWSLDSKHVKGYWTAWNRCVRVLLKLHPGNSLPIFASTSQDCQATKVLNVSLAYLRP